jgi:PAS domain S-box-containing protein
MLYSYGRNFSPFSAVTTALQTELAEQSKVPIEFREVSLEGQQFAGSESDEPTVDYLQTLFGGREPDLVVPCGGPAVRFALRLRPRLYPSVPFLLAAVDARHLNTFALDTNTTAVASQWNFPDLLDHVRRVLPGTTNFAVVLGASAVEGFWKQELEREWAGFTNRVGLVWLNQYSLEEMRQKVSHLPPHTVIFYFSCFVDAAGVPHEYDRAIKALRASANAPMVGLFEEELGLGIVGGPLLSLQEDGREAARVALRILNGEAAGNIQTPARETGAPMYDWRELRRWKISEDRLPPGSVVKYRSLTVWERHRGSIICALSVVLMQGVLIVGLIANSRRTRRAERSLRESEERMKLAAGAAGLSLWEWDFATDTVWLDGRSRERLGASEGQDSDYSRFLRMVHPDDRESVEQALARAISGDGQYEHVHRRLLSGGEVRWIAARGRVEFDAEHKPVRMRGVGMDITARKLAEEQARESERQFLLIANSAPVFIWTSGPDKLCTFVNRPWLEFRGRRLEQELGNGWAGGVHPADVTNCMKTYVDAFDARLPFTMEYRWERHDGHYRWIAVHGVPRYDTQKNFLGYVGSCVDVTERKEVEAEARRSHQELVHVNRVSTLGELAGSLAHELNQPLAAILSNAQAARRLMNGDRRNDGEVRDALKDIGDQGRRAGEIIAGMRGMLRKDPGEMAAQDLNRAVREVLEMMRSELLTRHVTPVLRLDPVLPSVKGHGVQLRQVLLNLLINACEAMSDVAAGGRELTIESRHLTEPEVEVSVADNGPGFPEEMLRNAFEPFQTTKTNGLGLGLAICRSIITAHGGRLTAANNSGKGATVSFTLPTQNGSGT